MILGQDAKRLGVFVFFDKDELIDDYVIYMLDSFKKACNDLIIVSNTKLNENNLNKFKQYTNEVYERENKGLDAGAFTAVYDKYHHTFNNYDELILINDTFYGPFEPFKDINQKMANHDLDFWGLCACYESENGFGTLRESKIPAHIQTFFIAYRRSVLESDAFNNYWQNYNINNMNSFESVVTKHETYFTNYLEQAGFIWDTYLDLSDFKSDDFKNNFNIYAYSAYQLIKYYHAPFIKRKNFVFERNDALFLNDGTDAKKALDYIKNNNLYDTEMILKNITRLYGPSDLYQGLNLNYILDDNEYHSEFSSIILVNSISDKLKYYVDNLNLKTEIRYINGNSKQYLLENRDELYKYDYIFYLNVKEDLNAATSVNECNLFRIVENTIASDNMIEQIKTILSNDKYLSCLLAPISYHNGYFNEISRRRFKDQLKTFNLKYQVNEFIAANPDFAVFDAKLLNDLDNSETDNDFIIFEILRLVNKNNKYAGKVYNKEYISNDIVSYEKMFANIFEDSKKYYTYPMISVSTAGILHKWIRKHLSLNTRKKLKAMIKKN